jgi:hypothetical protein
LKGEKELFRLLELLWLGCLDVSDHFSRDHAAFFVVVFGAPLVVTGCQQVRFDMVFEIFLSVGW